MQLDTNKNTKSFCSHLFDFSNTYLSRDVPSLWPRKKVVFCRFTVSEGFCLHDDNVDLEGGGGTLNSNMTSSSIKQLSTKCTLPSIAYNKTHSYSNLSLCPHVQFL